jgi:transcriptional regulator with XRE-family HTH domain
MLTTGYQLKAARALIGMEQTALAELAGLNVNSIRNMEASGSEAIAGRAENVQRVQRALEAAGVEFLNHGQPGVRLKATEQEMKI